MGLRRGAGVVQRIRVRPRLPHRRADALRLGQERVQAGPARRGRVPPQGRVPPGPIAALQGRVEPAQKCDARSQRRRDQETSGQASRRLHDGQLL